VFSIVTAFRLHAGLQTHSRTFDTGFICASAVRYYTSSPILDVDIKGGFIFCQIDLKGSKRLKGSHGIHLTIDTVVPALGKAIEFCSCTELLEVGC
jgi:hypothetical protein